MGINRLHNLDYLRGLAAFGVMVYHFYLWGIGRPSSEMFIGRVGMYGVSIFYVLSGLTLFHVYSSTMQINKAGLTSFFVKRGFRIMPLLWVVTLATVALRVVQGGSMPSLELLLLNLSGLFGLVAPAQYIGTGVWSIGNELVFYLFFPLFMLLYRKQRGLLALLSISLFALYCYYAFCVLEEFEALSGEGFDAYLNPLNQVFLFLSGFLAGVILQYKNLNPTTMLLLLTTSMGAFTFYPVSGDAINLVTGSTRLVFTLICLATCVAAYKLTPNVPRAVDKPLRILGEISYSLYLLHPLVWKVTIIVLKKYTDLSILPIFLICGIISLICSYVCYDFFEKFFVKQGRQLLTKLRAGHEPVKTFIS